MPPAVSAATQRLYDRLPEHLRRADAKQQIGDLPLLRYLSLVGDQAGAIDTLVDRFSFTPVDEGGAPEDARSDLVDPDNADLAWLPWLAQLVGARLFGLTDETAKRDAIRYASNGWRAGTRAAVADAARSELTGTRGVRVYDHATSIATLGDDTQWDVLIITRPDETPDFADVLQAIVDKHAKPAGVVLYWEAYEATWDLIETDAPTWSDIEALGSWFNIEGVGI